MLTDHTIHQDVEPIKIIIKYESEPIYTYSLHNQKPCNVIPSTTRTASPILTDDCDYNEIQDTPDDNSLTEHSELSNSSLKCKCTGRSDGNKNATTDKGQTLLTSYFSKSTSSTAKPVQSVPDEKPQRRPPKRDLQKRRAKRVLRKYQRLPKVRQRRQPSKLLQILRNFKRSSLEGLFEHNPVILNVYRCFNSIDLFTRLLFDLHNMSGATATQNVKRPGKSSADELGKRLKIESPPFADDGAGESPTAAAILADRDGCSLPKRGQKGQRTVDNTKLMMLPVSREDTNEKDFCKCLCVFLCENSILNSGFAVFAQNFMDKVEETYFAEDRPDKVDEFHAILQKFSVDSEKAPDLYYVSLP